MKKIEILCLLFFAACTPTSPLVSMRWSGVGEKPDLQKFAGSLGGETLQTSFGEEIRFQEQKIDHYRVENAFVKTVHQKNKGLVFQSAVLAKKIASLRLLQARKLDQNKEKIWDLFKADHFYFSRAQLIFPLEVVFVTKPDVQAVIYAVTRSPNSPLRALYIRENADLLRDEAVGSNLTEMIESSSLLFTDGPKNSPLSPVKIVRKAQPVGLADLLIDVSSFSPSKITSTSSLEYPTTDSRFDDVQAFYYSHQILQWFNQKWGIALGAPLSLLTHLDFPEKTNAAFYFQNQIRLGTGDDVTYANIAWDPTIVMHETSHAVIDSLARLPFQGEGGSINEGYADLFTTFFLGSPLLGENSYLAGPYRRRVDQVLKFSEKNGGLYHDSAIVSGFFWRLKGLMGPDPALNLAIHVLNRLGPSTDFADFSLALHEQTEALFQADDLKKINQLMKEQELP